MKNFIKNHSVIFATICIALAVGLTAGLFVLTDGLETWDPNEIFTRDRNEDNILYDQYDDMEKTPHSSGISIEIDKGLVRLDGEIKDSEKSEDVEFIFASMELSAGTYTYTCFDHPSLTTYYSMIRYTDDTGAVHVVFADFNNSNISIPDVTVDDYKTFTLTEKTDVEFVIVACVGTDCDGVVAKPVLVSGEDEGNFYAK